MSEPAFFDAGGRVVAFARRSDPDTSHEAAAFILPSIRQLHWAVLGYAADCEPWGFTDPDLNAHFGTTSSTYRTRRSELVAMGLIVDTGQRRTHSNGGRKFAIWRITPEGLARRGPAAQAA